MRMNKFDQKLIINKQILQNDSPQVKCVNLLVSCVESSFTVLLLVAWAKRQTGVTVINEIYSFNLSQSCQHLTWRDPWVSEMTADAMHQPKKSAFVRNRE